MGNDKNYRQKIEEHRQEVELDDVQLRRTRTRRTQNKKKPTKSPLLSILVFVFILIPLGILAYVWLVYEPEQIADSPVDKPVVQIEKNNEAAATGSEEDDEEKEISSEATAEPSTDNDKEAQQSEDVEVDAQTQAQIAAAAAEAERKLKEQKEKEEADKQAQAQTGKVHKVVTGDTLFSISRQYFNGSVAQVDEIKRLNNLTSENLTVGQELILP